MNWSEIEKITQECQKNPPAQANGFNAVGIVLPQDYKEFLGRMNGIEGFVTPEQYLILWRLEELFELNEAYVVDEFLPNVVLMGTDGGDTGYGYDSVREQYIATPLVGMDPSETKLMGGSFGDFLKTLVTE